MKRSGLAIAIAALVMLVSSQAWAGSKVKIMNVWQETEESGFRAESDFCADSIAHPVVTWLLKKDAKVRFIAKVKKPNGKTKTWQTDYMPYEAGSKWTCLACEFGFKETWSDVGMHRMRLKIQTKNGGSSFDTFYWMSRDCAAEAMTAPPEARHE